MAEPANQNPEDLSITSHRAEPEATEKGWILALILIYLVITLWTLNVGYVDFGDGNYIYISRRISQGLVLYRDINSPQPPLHTMVGTVLQYASMPIRALVSQWDEELARTTDILVFRVYLALLHALVMWVIWRLTLYLLDDPAARILAIAVYLILPNTYLWSRGFQSENHQILFLYGAFLFLLWNRPKGVILAGIFSVLGLCTNMTFAPYLVLFLLYILLTRPPAWYTFPLIVLGGLAGIFALFHFWSDGYLIENTITNQMGSFPEMPHLPRYVWGKLLSEGGDLLRVQGGFIFMAILAIVIRAGGRIGGPFRGLILWFSMFALGAIVFVAKGGTAEYIFVLGEPIVAIFSAQFLYTLMLGAEFDLGPSEAERNPGVYSVRWIIAIFGLTVLLYQPLDHLYRTLVTQTTYEAPERISLRMAFVINEYTRPDRDILFAPPYYALLTDTRVLGECSETFLWYLRMRKGERVYLDGNSPENQTYRENTELWGSRVFEEPGTGRQYVYADPGTHRLLARMVDELDSGQVALALPRSGQLGDIPELREAVRRNFRPPTDSEWNWLMGVLLEGETESSVSIQREFDSKTGELTSVSIRSLSGYRLNMKRDPNTREIDWVAIQTLNERLEFFFPR